VRRRITDEPQRHEHHDDAGGDTSTGGCVVTPNETIGPYPSRVDLFRSDIREGKPGIQLDLGLTVVNTANSCAALSGVNVEIWQCDAAGNYSQYGSEQAKTYLRGIQTTDASGQVSMPRVARIRRRMCVTASSPTA